MRFSWHTLTRLSALITSRRTPNGRRQMFAMGGGLGMAAVGFTAAYQSRTSFLSEEKDEHCERLSNHRSLIPQNLCSLLGIEELKAEERVAHIPKSHYAHVSALSSNATQTPPAHWDHNWDK